MSRGTDVGHITRLGSPFSLNPRTTARLPRRPRADAECSLSSSALNTFAVADWKPLSGYQDARKD